MPTALAVSNVIQLQAWCADAEQASVNSWNYLVTAVGPSPATDQDVVDYFDANIEGDMKSLIVNSATYQGCLARLKNVLPLPAPVFSNSHSGVGTAGAIGLPRQSCGLLSYKTNLAGARGRGRTYLPFPSTSDNQGGGGVANTYVTKATALGVILFGPLLVSTGGRTATLQLIIYHQKGTGSPAAIPVTTVVVSHSWATQKRRGSFGKANSSPF